MGLSVDRLSPVASTDFQKSALATTAAHLHLLRGPMHHATVNLSRTMTLGLRAPRTPITKVAYVQSRASSALIAGGRMIGAGRIASVVVTPSETEISWSIRDGGSTIAVSIEAPWPGRTADLDTVRQHVDSCRQAFLHAAGALAGIDAVHVAADTSDLLTSLGHLICGRPEGRPKWPSPPPDASSVRSACMDAAIDYAVMVACHAPDLAGSRIVVRAPLQTGDAPTLEIDARASNGPRITMQAPPGPPSLASIDAATEIARDETDGTMILRPIQASTNDGLIDPVEMLRRSGRLPSISLGAFR